MKPRRNQTRHNVTAILYDKRGRVLSIGKNSYLRTHPYQARCAAKVGLPEKQWIHAEIDAIIRCRNLKDAHRIFVSRISKAGDYGLAKPCPICEQAIKEAGIKHVEWTV